MAFSKEFAEFVWRRSDNPYSEDHFPNEMSDWIERLAKDYAQRPLVGDGIGARPVPADEPEPGDSGVTIPAGEFVMSEPGVQLLDKLANRVDAIEGQLIMRPGPTGWTCEFVGKFDRLVTRVRDLEQLQFDSRIAIMAKQVGRINGRIDGFDQIFKEHEGIKSDIADHDKAVVTMAEALKVGTEGRETLLKRVVLLESTLTLAMQAVAATDEMVKGLAKTCEDSATVHRRVDEWASRMNQVSGIVHENTNRILNLEDSLSSDSKIAKRIDELTSHVDDLIAKMVELERVAGVDRRMIRAGQAVLKDHEGRLGGPGIYTDKIKAQLDGVE